MSEFEVAYIFEREGKWVARMRAYLWGGEFAELRAIVMEAPPQTKWETCEGGGVRFEYEIAATEDQIAESKRAQEQWEAESRAREYAQYERLRAKYGRRG